MNMVPEGSSQDDHMRLHTGYVITFSGEEGAEHDLVVSRLALTLGAMGRRVLVIDADPLSRATRNLGIDQGPASIWLIDMILTMRHESPIQGMITQSSLPNIDGIPGGPELDKIEDELGRRGIDPLAAMMTVIKPLKLHYDYILVNASTDPSNLLNFSSFVASDYAVLVTKPQPTRKLQAFAEEIHDIVSENNPLLRPLGILVNQADEAARVSLTNDAHAADMSLFETVLPRGNAGETSGSYKKLACEILDKITHPQD
jgi:chromosome partitioning protein